MDTCEICGARIVPMGGPPKSPILLVGEAPGTEELNTGIPWSGQGGEVLKAELARVGVQYSQCRATNLWLHYPKEDEFDYHFKHLVEALKTARLALIMGSEPVQQLTQDSVSNQYGLRVQSPYIPDSCYAIACYNPAIALHKGTTIGELRLTIERFARIYKDVIGGKK